jgi:hypothetical protein
VLSGLYESAPITVSGLDAPAGLSIAGGEHAVNGGGWSTAPATASNGDVVRVRRNASGAVGSTVETTLTIGGASGAFAVTTVANAESSALALRFAVDPGDARRGLIDGCVGALKAAGIWAKLDALYLLAAHHAQAAQRNWIQDAFNIAPFGSPTFTTDRGYAGDGVGAYLDTGFNDLTGSALWTQDTMALGAYINAYAGGSNAFLGLTSGTSLRIGATAANITTRIHSATSFNPGFTNPNPGHIVVTRDTATSSRCLRNGASVSTSSAASAASGGANIVGFRSVSSYNADQMACLHIGGFLAPAEVADLYSAILTYLTAIGAS